MVDFIKSVSEIITAVIVILGALSRFEKWSKGKITNWLFKSINERLTKTENDMNERFGKTERDILKLIIMSHDMPIEERLNAGKRYVENGGNSEVKAHYMVLKEKYEEKIRKEEIKYGE